VEELPRSKRGYGLKNIRINRSLDAFTLLLRDKRKRNFYKKTILTNNKKQVNNEN